MFRKQQNEVYSFVRGLGAETQKLQVDIIVWTMGTEAEWPMKLAVSSCEAISQK